MSTLPTGRYLIGVRVGIDGDAHKRANADARFAAALASTDYGHLPITASGATIGLEPWSNRGGNDLVAGIDVTFGAGANLNVLLRYIARGLNAAVNGTASDGQPTDRQLGGEILAAFLSSTSSMSPTDNPSQTVRGARVTINGVAAPAATPPVVRPQVVVAPPIDVPVAPTIAAPPAVAPTAHLTPALVSHYQGILYALAYLPVRADVDGALGSHSAAALRLFQDNYNREQAAHADRFRPARVTVNGQLDTATQQALENYRGIARWLPEGQINGQSPPPAVQPPVVQPVVRPPVTAQPPVVRPPAPQPVVQPPVVRPPPTSTLEVRPPAPLGTPGTPPIVQPPAPIGPTAPATSGTPWGTIALVSLTLATGYTGYRYRHEIRAAFGTHAPAARQQAEQYATRAGAAIRRGSKASARYAGSRLSRYGAV